MMTPDEIVELREHALHGVLTTEEALGLLNEIVELRARCNMLAQRADAMLAETRRLRNALTT